jgi:hypothetical protein
VKHVLVATCATAIASLLMLVGLSDIADGPRVFTQPETVSAGAKHMHPILCDSRDAQFCFEALQRAEEAPKTRK